jgi:hypothetical protein
VICKGASHLFLIGQVLPRLRVAIWVILLVSADAKWTGQHSWHRSANNGKVKLTCELPMFHDVLY